MKKTFAAVLGLVIVLSLATPALAKKKHRRHHKKHHVESAQPAPQR